MKTIVRLSCLAVTLLIITGTLVSTAGAVSDPFVGYWTSTDTDGSHQILTIGGGGGSSYHVRYYDFGASACGLDPETGEILYAASAEGTLTLSNGLLSGTSPVYCQTAPPTFLTEGFVQYTYDPNTDTLTDSFGVVWYH